jgi:hypothetical protein
MKTVGKAGLRSGESTIGAIKLVVPATSLVQTHGQAQLGSSHAWVRVNTFAIELHQASAIGIGQAMLINTLRRICGQQRHRPTGSLVCPLTACTG